jgi:hypothetical protein
MTRTIHKVGGGHAEHSDKPVRYTAVRHVRVGDELLPPGSEVPVSGPRAAAMIRRGEIQQVIEPGV